MKKGVFILITGIFLIILGSFLTLISTSSIESSGIFIVFPFVFIVSGPVSPLIFGVMFILFVIMLVLPFYIFYKLSAWPYPEEIEPQQAIPETKICPICGTVVPFKAKYCYNCGYAFKEHLEA